MTVLLVLRLLALLSLFGRALPATILHSHLDHHLNDTDIASTDFVMKKCDCRQLCMEDETCTAVTASETGVRVKCDFSSTSQPGMTSAVTGAITYVKSVACEAPYEMVEGVGCLWISDIKVDFNTAKTSCPENAGVTRLASPATDPIYWRMTKYIINKGTPQSNMWCGVSLVGTDWVWMDGHTMPVTVGERLWKGGEPKGGRPCASMRYHPSTGGYYHFVDHNCDLVFNFICEML